LSRQIVACLTTSASPGIHELAVKLGHNPLNQPRHRLRLIVVQHVTTVGQGDNFNLRHRFQAFVVLRTG